MKTQLATTSLNQLNTTGTTARATRLAIQSHKTSVAKSMEPHGYPIHHPFERALEKKIYQANNHKTLKLASGLCHKSFRIFKMLHIPNQLILLVNGRTTRVR